MVDEWTQEFRASGPVTHLSGELFVHLLSGLCVGCNVAGDADGDEQSGGQHDLIGGVE